VDAVRAIEKERSAGVRRQVKKVWVTWENQRRNITLSRELGAVLYIVGYGGRGRLARYLSCLRKTVAILGSEKPDLLFVQNPSIVLSLFAVLYGKAFRTPVIVDAHNAGLFPFGGEKDWANRLAKFLLRQATVTIVSNDGLAVHVEAEGGTPFVLADPLPAFPAVEPASLKGRRNVLYVCSYAADEPYREVIEAARSLDDETFIYVTGNPGKKLERIPGGIPRNVVITGFLPEGQYASMLASVDVVLVLTNREDCLVCGAYEAVSMGKPLVLSDTHALRAYFRRGTVFTDNSVGDIGKKITEAIEIISPLAMEIRALREELSASWQIKRAAFEEVVGHLVRGKW
jgi:glycosyltransferase involved in cell wall biosynthesis